MAQPPHADNGLTPSPPGADHRLREAMRLAELRTLALRAFLVSTALVACSTRVDYRSEADYEPASRAWQRLELTLTGHRSIHVDSGVDCSGQLVLVDLGGRATTFGVMSAGSTRPVTTSGPLPASTILDEAALRSVLPAMSAAEAKELLRIYELACGGPKLGFPRTTALTALRTRSFYL